MQNVGLDEAQAEKISGKNINNLRYADDTTLLAESKEELKSPFTPTVSYVFCFSSYPFYASFPSPQAQGWYLPVFLL